ncbi:MAG: hypothetical protein O7B23_01435 [Deltaproteobacteria bacterium]|nr:hypothetical protein [Deltaproteobacteria bacterium]
MPAKLTPLVLLASTWLLACSHEVVRLQAAPPSPAPLQAPLPLTVAISLGSFERALLVNGVALTTIYARQLRKSGLFEGVMFPVPLGAEPRWEIELSGWDSASEPNSNFWKGLLATLPPLALFITFQNDYTLQLEALLLDDREIVASYLGEASIRHRYKKYANRVDMNIEALEVTVRDATSRIVGALVQDVRRLAQLNQRVR